MSTNALRTGQVFAGWHNMEVFGVRAADRPLLYVWVTDVWVNTVESSVLLATPSPWLFIMFAHVMLRGAAAVRPQLNRISQMEFSYFTLARFLIACRVGMSPNETHDIGIEQSFITPFPELLRKIIDGRGFLWWFICDVRFDRALALLAYRRSAELD